MATFLEEWQEKNKWFEDDKDDRHVDATDVKNKLDEFYAIENPTQKDFNEMFTWINRFEQDVPVKDVPILGPIYGKHRAELRDLYNKTFPDREKGENYDAFVEAYKIEDEDKRNLKLKQLRKNQKQSPHKGSLIGNQDVKAALARGAAKNPQEEKKYEGPFGKLGEYFSKNANAREKLFSYIGEMGKELVKPIEPGQAAAGALVPTLSRGLSRGEKKYQADQAAEAKMLKDMATAQKDANPMQHYTNKMKEARYMAWSKGINPDTAEGTAWIGSWLNSQGMASGLADLSASIKSMSEAMMIETDPNKKTEMQKQIDMLNEQITGMIMQGSGSGVSEEVIDYSSTIKNN